MFGHDAKAARLSWPTDTLQFLFVLHRYRELFQIKNLTWILDRTLRVGGSKDTANKEVVFELPTPRVHDLVERAANLRRRGNIST